MSLCLDHSPGAQESEMLGNLDLAEVQNGLEVTDAKRSVAQEVKNTQPTLVAKAFVNLNQMHALGGIYRYRYMSRMALDGSRGDPHGIEIYRRLLWVEADEGLPQFSRVATARKPS